MIFLLFSFPVLSFNSCSLFIVCNILVIFSPFVSAVFCFFLVIMFYALSLFLIHKRFHLYLQNPLQ